MVYSRYFNWNMHYGVIVFYQLFLAFIAYFGTNVVAIRFISRISDQWNTFHRTGSRVWIILERFLFPVYGSDDWFCVSLNFCNYIVPFFHISNIVHVRCSFEICSVRLLYRNVVVSCKCSLIGWWCMV